MRKVWDSDGTRSVYASSHSFYVNDYGVLDRLATGKVWKMTDPTSMTCTCGHLEHIHEHFEDACDWNSDRNGDDGKGFNCKCQGFESKVEDDLEQQSDSS